jgi:fatty-acyl-CoA synthase
VTTFRGPPLAEEAGLGALTLPGLLDEAAARHGDREALVFPAGDVRLTYAELHAEAHRMAKALVARGLTKGERVAVLIANRPEWIVAAFGVTMAGGVMVPLNTWFEPPELEFVLRHCDASLLLMQEHFLHRDYADDLRGVLPQLPLLQDVVTLDRWDEFLASGDAVDDGALPTVSPLDDATIIYTSGSTAEPKGVLHHHQAATIQSWRFAQHLRIDEETRTWSAFPLFWTAGFAMIMGGTLAGGGCLVLTERFEPGEALRVMEAERVTAAHAWPHQAGELEDHPDWAATDLSSLRHVEAFSSFGRHPKVQVDDVWSPRQAFGLTETFTIISSDPADTPRQGEEMHAGHVLPGNGIRILDPETGQPQPTAGVGEIAVKGPTLMKGYIKATASPLDADGYFHTGDAGWVDDDNCLHWTGRTSDLIKTGGANVSPVEVETALLHHPGLKVAHAIGVPDPLLGELVVVCAVAHDDATVDEDDVRSFLRRRLASYKIPRHVVFVSEEDLSLTGNAKVRTSALRALAAERLA